MEAMKQPRAVRVSKYLAMHLRHRPERIGITLDRGGWVDVDELIAACAGNGFPITRAELDHVVASNDKHRYAFDASGQRIRANQGHSVGVELDLPAVTPPDVLFHGTVERYLLDQAGIAPSTLVDLRRDLLKA